MLERAAMVIRCREFYRRKARDKRPARLLVKCGDCSDKFEIHHGPEAEDLGIAGVGMVGRLLRLCRENITRKVSNSSPGEIDLFV